MADLTKRGVSFGYVWGRWFPGLSDPFHFVVRKTLGYTLREYGFCKPLRMVYGFLTLIDYSFAIVFRIRIPALRNRVLLVDRYIYDMLADLDFRRFKISPTLRRLLIMMNPRPDITFFLDVSPQIACSRKKDLSLVDAEAYRKIYLRIASVYGFRRIDNVDFNDAHNRILTDILELIDHKQPKLKSHEVLRAS